MNIRVFINSTSDNFFFLCLYKTVTSFMEKPFLIALKNSSELQNNIITTVKIYDIHFPLLIKNIQNKLFIKNLFLSLMSFFQTFPEHGKTFVRKFVDILIVVDNNIVFIVDKFIFSPVYCFRRSSKWGGGRDWHTFCRQFFRQKLFWYVRRSFGESPAVHLDRRRTGKEMSKSQKNMSNDFSTKRENM